MSDMLHVPNVIAFSSREGNYNETRAENIQRNISKLF